MSDKWPLHLDALVSLSFQLTVLIVVSIMPLTVAGADRWRCVHI